MPNVTRKDFVRATSRLTLTARRRTERQARHVLHRLWNYRDGTLVGLTVPALPPFAAASETLTREQRARLLDTGRADLAALPFGTLDATTRPALARFFGGPGAPDASARHARRLTFPMLVALLGLDGARIVCELWSGKNLPTREQLDAHHPDPEEAARIHGRQLARATRQRAWQRAQGAPAVVAFTR